MSAFQQCKKNFMLLLCIEVSDKKNLPVHDEWTQCDVSNE